MKRLIPGLFVCALLWSSCGGGGGTNNRQSPPPAATISISPINTSVQAGATQQFTAGVSNTTDISVTWQVNGAAGGSSTFGTISTSGLYTAPDTVPNGTITITAVSHADSSKSANATVSLEYPQPTIAAIMPNSTSIRSPNTVVVINGSGFSKMSTIFAGGNPAQTSFLNSSQLSTVVPASLLGTAGNVNISVANPTPGGGIATASLQVIAGTLAINVTDVPAAAAGSVAVTGPMGFSATLTTTQTLQNLTLGSYTITANEIKYGSSRFVPRNPIQSANLKDGSLVSTSVAYSTIIPLSTKVLDAAGLNSLTVAGDKSSISISSSSPIATNLEPGDVLIINPCPGAPNGLLVRITSSQIIGNTVVATIQKATLVDAFQQTNADMQHVLSSDQLVSAKALRSGVHVIQKEPAVTGASTQATTALADSCAGNPVTFIEAVDVPLSDDPIDPLSQVVANGQLELCPSINVSADISFFHLNSASLSVTTGEHSHIGIDASNGTQLTVDKRFDLVKLEYAPIIIELGPIPVEVTPKLTIFFDVQGTLFATFSLGLDQDAKGTLGIQYDGSNVMPIHDFNQAFAFEPLLIHPSGAFDVKTTFGAQIDASVLDGVISPHADLGAVLDFAADPSTNPWWTLNLGLTSGAGVDIDLGFTHPDPEFDVDFGRTQIAAAPGPFQPPVVILSGISPPNPVATPGPQTFTLQGSGFDSSSLVTLCFGGACNTVTPLASAGSSLTVSTVLAAGRWMAQVNNGNGGGNSATFGFTVYPAPSAVNIDQIAPMPLFAASTRQAITAVGSGFSTGASLRLCINAICKDLTDTTISSDSQELTANTPLATPGLWTAEITNPDGTRSNAFGFTVQAPLALTLAPLSGIINSTNFTFTGTGARPNGSVSIAITSPGGNSQLQGTTADAQGQFKYGPVTFSKVGTYQATAREQTTGNASASVSFVVSNSLIAAVSSATVAVNGAAYSINGVGGTPFGTVSLNQTNPDSTTQSFSTTADASGSFSFGPFTAKQPGVFSAVVKDSTTAQQSPALTWTAVTAAGVSASVSPLTGILNSTPFLITGTGATRASGVTGQMALPDHSGKLLKTLADSSGNFSFGSLIGTQSGTYALTVIDDATSATAPTVTWSVNPNQNTVLKNMTVFPTAFNPQFVFGSSSPAVLGFQISSPPATPLSGTVSAITSSNGQWLTVDGHPSVTWSGTETISVTADPTGLTPNTYTAMLKFESTAASNSPVIVPVTATVLPALAITTTTLPDAISGQAYRFQLQAIGGTGSGYHWSINGTLPYGVSFDSNTGIFSGVPTSIDGSTTLTLGISVQDSGGHFSAVTLPLIYRAGLVQLGYSPANFVFVTGSTFSAGNSITIQATGGVPPLTWAATNLPPGLTMDTSSGLISGIPTKPGNFPATVTVSDSRGQAVTASYVLPVILIPLKIADSSNQTPPVLRPGTVGQPYQQVLNGLAGSQAGYKWSVAGAVPPGVTAQVVPACTGSTCGFEFVGTPTSAGTYVSVVTLTDSLGDTTTQTASVIINAGTPPQITSSTLSLATIGQPYLASLSASGGSGTLQWSLVTPIPDPALSLSAAGILSGTPSLQNDCFTGPAFFLGAGFPDPKVFQVRVTDGSGNSDTRQFCLPSFYTTPQVGLLTPNTLTVDGSNHTITLSGSNFRPDATIFVGGTALPTTFIDNGHLSFLLTPSQTAAFGIGGTSGGLNEGIYTLHVGGNYANPSNNQTLSIYDPAPTLSNTTAVVNNSTSTPCHPNVNCQLVVSGTGFVFSTQYTIAETGTTLVTSATQGTAIPWNTVVTSAFAVPAAGTYTLIVQNGNQHGGGSATATMSFTVGN